MENGSSTFKKAAAITAVTAGLAAGAGAALWLAKGRPGVRRPVEDIENGVAYSVPQWWKDVDPADLSEGYTSAARSKKDGESGAAVFAFGGDSIEGGLEETTTETAMARAEYFRPFAETTVLESEPFGENGHRVAWESVSEEGRTYGVLVQLRTEKRPAFVLGMAHDGGRLARKLVDATVATAALTEETVED
ncbi:hypothetical protein [Salininema proteolyticum]|uniref:Polyketide cyclase / dehydrase and lipid transport n=1 Tax=Salininema proteolyticum TaxID=1607685 RepID=A0ABV8TUB3_9ACTN